MHFFELSTLNIKFPEIVTFLVAVHSSQNVQFVLIFHQRTVRPRHRDLTYLLATIIFRFLEHTRPFFSFQVETINSILIFAIQLSESSKHYYRFSN